MLQQLQLPHRDAALHHSTCICMRTCNEITSVMHSNQNGRYSRINKTITITKKRVRIHTRRFTCIHTYTHQHHGGGMQNRTGLCKKTLKSPPRQVPHTS